MSYPDDARRDLLLLAGRDAHALLLLGELFDAALDETPVDVTALRAHCVQVDDKAAAAQLDFLLVNLPSYIKAWTDETDEPSAKSWEKEILAALFTLRTGSLACARCLEIAWNIGLLEPRTAGFIDGPKCREAALQPRLRIVA